MRRIDETKYMKESYEKAYEEYKNMKEGTFDFNKYTEIQREKSMEKIKTFLIQVNREFPYTYY